MRILRTLFVFLAGMAVMWFILHDRPIPPKHVVYRKYPQLPKKPPPAKNPERTRLETIFAEPIQSAGEEKKRAEFLTMVNELVPILWTISQDNYHAMSPSEFRDAMLSFVNELDPHSEYIPTKKSSAYMRRVSDGIVSGMGMDLRFQFVPGTRKLAALVSDVSPRGAAEVAGIHKGDELLAIGGIAVSSLKSDILPEQACREAGRQVMLTIKRSGAPHPLALTLLCRLEKLETVQGHSFGQHYGYLRITEFIDVTNKEDGTAGQVKTTLARLLKENGGALNGLVLDLRGNPGGAVESGYAVASELLNMPGAVLLAVRDRSGVRTEAHASTGNIHFAKVPILVLVNSESASSSEIVSGALRWHGRAIIAGSGDTYGKGTAQEVIVLDMGDGSSSVVQLTIEEFLVGGQYVVQGRGITPDILIDDPLYSDTERERDQLGYITTPDTGARMPPIDKNGADYRTALKMLRALHLHVRK